MIAYLEGTLLHADLDSCVVLTPSGVGYHVFLTVRGLSGLPAQGEAVRFFVFTVVREDALTLFGFISWEERQTFATLLAAPKLGPKTALAMLGCFSPGELATCIATDDAASLARVPGIGVKTAKRLLLDLKDKIHATPTVQSSRVSPPASAYGDCVAALISLGYARHEVEEIVRTVFEADDLLDTGTAIRQALKLLAAK